VHALLAFLFNAMILALGDNIFATVMSSQARPRKRLSVADPHAPRYRLAC